MNGAGENGLAEPISTDVRLRIIGFTYAHGGPFSVRADRIDALMPDRLNAGDTVLFLANGSRVHVRCHYEDALEALMDALDAVPAKAKAPVEP